MSFCPSHYCTRCIKKMDVLMQPACVIITIDIEFIILINLQVFIIFQMIRCKTNKSASNYKSITVNFI